jgi:hypothetical protein
MLIQIIGYWCLSIAVIGEMVILITAIYKPINNQANIMLALYFIAAILALH